MELIVCEKPTQAKEYVNVFTAFTKKEFKQYKGYYSNGSMTISYAIGHLVQLADANLYDPKYLNWNINDLPIIPDAFKYVINPKTKDQYIVLKELLSKSTTIYNATDAEREGELIFRLILNQTNFDYSKKCIKRIWVTVCKYDTIIKSYKEAKDQSFYNNLYDAARARQISDWLIGINLTRVLTVSSGMNTTLTLGRVQTAVLSLIVERYKNHINFIAKDTYTPEILLYNLPFPLQYNTTFFDVQEAEIIINTIKKTASFNLVLEEETKEITQPLLYSLTELQILCNKKYGYTASETLECAQKLYESQLISYPRTSSNYLSKALIDDAIETLESLQKNYYKNIDSKKHAFLNSQEIKEHFIFDDKKTSDHYAIMPIIHNMNQTTGLSSKEANIFHEIITIFFQTFSKKSIVKFQKVYYYLNDAKENPTYFSTSFKNIVYPGFNIFNENSSNNSEEELEIQSLLQKLNFSEPFTLQSANIKKGKTTPPLLFTEATLLQAMKNPTAHEKIEENKKHIKSLGTPATNDKFLPILLKRNYVTFNKKFIVPEALGISIIESLSGTKLTSIALTANIEASLDNVKNGTLEFSKYMKAMVNYTITTTEEVKLYSKNIGSNVKNENKERMPCPSCGTGSIYLAKKKTHYYCSNYQNNENDKVCTFTIYRTINQYTLKQKDIEDLIFQGKTKLLPFKTKDNKEYKAHLIINSEKKTQILINTKK